MKHPFVILVGMDEQNLIVAGSIDKDYYDALPWEELDRIFDEMKEKVSPDIAEFRLFFVDIPREAIMEHFRTPRLEGEIAPARLPESEAAP